MNRGKWATVNCVLGQGGSTRFGTITKWVRFGCDEERERVREKKKMEWGYERSMSRGGNI